MSDFHFDEAETVEEMLARMRSHAKQSSNRPQQSYAVQGRAYQNEDTEWPERQPYAPAPYAQPYNAPPQYVSSQPQDTVRPVSPPAYMDYVPADRYPLRRKKDMGFAAKVAICAGFFVLGAVSALAANAVVSNGNGNNLLNRQNYASDVQTYPEPVQHQDMPATAYATDSFAYDPEIPQPASAYIADDFAVEYGVVPENAAMHEPESRLIEPTWEYPLSSLRLEDHENFHYVYWHFIYNVQVPMLTTFTWYGRYFLIPDMQDNGVFFTTMLNHHFYSVKYEAGESFTHMVLADTIHMFITAYTDTGDLQHAVNILAEELGRITFAQG